MPWVRGGHKAVPALLWRAGVFSPVDAFCGSGGVALPGASQGYPDNNEPCPSCVPWSSRKHICLSAKDLSRTCRCRPMARSRACGQSWRVLACCRELPVLPSHGLHLLLPLVISATKQMFFSRRVGRPGARRNSGRTDQAAPVPGQKGTSVPGGSAAAQVSAS